MPEFDILATHTENQIEQDADQPVETPVLLTTTTNRRGQTRTVTVTPTITPTTQVTTTTSTPIRQPVIPTTSTSTSTTATDQDTTNTINTSGTSSQTTNSDTTSTTSETESTTSIDTSTSSDSSSTSSSTSPTISLPTQSSSSSSSSVVTPKVTRVPSDGSSSSSISTGAWVAIGLSGLVGLIILFVFFKFIRRRILASKSKKSDLPFDRAHAEELNDADYYNNNSPTMYNTDRLFSGDFSSPRPPTMIDQAVAARMVIPDGQNDSQLSLNQNHYANSDPNYMFNSPDVMPVYPQQAFVNQPVMYDNGYGVYNQNGQQMQAPMVNQYDQVSGVGAAPNYVPNQLPQSPPQTSRGHAQQPPNPRNDLDDAYAGI